MLREEVDVLDAHRETDPHLYRYAAPVRRQKLAATGDYLDRQLVEYSATGRLPDARLPDLTFVVDQEVEVNGIGDLETLGPLAELLLRLSLIQQKREGGSRAEPGDRRERCRQARQVELLQVE